MNRHSAYTALLQRHRSMVWRMCWISARGDFERCRDLVQEVSIALWLHFDKLRPGTSPHEEKAWVRWLTRTTLDHQCRHQRPPMLALTNAMAESIPENGSMAEDIEDLMAVLSSEEQQLLRLHIEGYRADEIAQTMGLNRDAVYQRLHRAVGKMRRVALLLLLFCLVATVAVAVVPQWRQWVTSRTVKEEKPLEAPLKPSESKPLFVDTMSTTIVDTPARRRVWVAPAPLPYLVDVHDTTIPSPRVPCGCPDTIGTIGQREDCISFDDYDESVEETLPPVTIIVNHDIIVVEGAEDEPVNVYDAQGRLVATVQCNGRCSLVIGANSNNSTTSGYAAYWVEVGSRPRQQVFLRASYYNSRSISLF